MGYVAGGDVVNAAPAVFCAYVGVLTALATTEAGAQVRWHYKLPQYQAQAGTTGLGFCLAVENHNLSCLVTHKLVFLVGM